MGVGEGVGGPFCGIQAEEGEAPGRALPEWPVRGLGSRVRGLGFGSGVRGLGSRVRGLGSGTGVRGLGSGVQDLGFRSGSGVWGLGSRVRGLGSGVWGLGPGLGGGCPGVAVPTVNPTATCGLIQVLKPEVELLQFACG